ncbi:uncharacterized protein LOC106168755 [Lingula anatina]|uniref:Uncharacterized protein LOC106168755 n=1 Tax=Lingula anatina TaxID=7574 RepID=A0A2R2MQN4_LINAN|nr:uncharacterized protein LOC106168755 [Lingula anatina]|eukprot:XP_023932312.1 uncharacterized protein LOC106168755 [Lingula anatina]
MAERAAAFKALCAFYVLVIVSKTICALTEWKEGLQYNRNYVNSAANYLTQKGDMNRHVKPSPQQVGEVSRTSRAVRGKEIRRKIYEEYKDFYTTIGLQVVDDSVARREYMDAVRRESDSGVSNLNTLEKQQEEKLPGDVLVMKRLCSALRFGRLPDNEVPQHTLPKFVSYISEMKGHKGSILEIGSGYTVSLLADTTHTYTAIALLIQDSKLPVKENLTYHSIPNLYVGSLFQDNLPAAVEYLYNDNQVLFNTILLSNLTSMVGDLLPHEYEELLARLLSLARNTYVADISTNNKHMLNFFKNWENLPVLLNKCCTVAGLDCVVEQVKGYFGGWNNGREDLYKVQVLTGTRNLPESFCEKSLLEGECYLHFGNESEPVAIHYNDGSQLLVPETSDCIPLQVINYIGPIQSTKERLLYQLLHVPYRDDQRSCTLYINGSNIVSLQDTPVKTGIDSHMWSCEENPQMHALVKKLVDLDPSLTGTEPHEKGLHSAKAGQISPHNFNQKQPQEDRGARVQQPYEQVDSVAERWNRLNNDVKEAAEKDQEQVQRLNKQWDREGNPPLPQQDPVLVRLDKTWRREEDKVGLDPPAVQGQVQGKVQSQGKESLSRNIDPALTKDEKELRLAMGSLGGVKGMEGNPVIAQPKKPIETEGQLPELEKNIIHQKVSSPKYVQNLRSIQHGGTTTTLKSVIREFDSLNNEPVPLAEQHQIPKPVPKRIHGNARKIYRNKYQGVEQQDSRQADYLKNDLVQNGADHLGPVGKIEQQPVVFKPREQGGQIEKRKDGMRRLLQNDAQQGLSLSVREKLDKYKEDFKKTLMNRYKAQRTKIDNDHDQIESKKVTSTQGPVKKMASKTATPSSLSSKEPLVSLNGIRKDSTDQQAAAAQKSELGNNESPVTSVKPELREPARTVREKHQPMEHTFGPKHKEESVYDSEWKLIKNDIAALNGKERNFFSVLTYGGNQQVLLGAKIAHRYPNSTVLSVLDTSSARHMPGLRKMITSLGAKNFILLVNNLSPGTVDKIVKMPEIFQIQILGLETFHHLTSLGQGFLYYLGHLLTMAHTTYLEVPSPEQLVMADLLLGNSTGPEQTHAVFKGMIFETLKLHGLENEAEVSLVDDVDILRGYTLATKLVKITLGHMQRTGTWN